MPKRINKISRSSNPEYRGRHRFEHWQVDNQVYFITARCRDRRPALATESAKAVFWDRFEYYTAEFGFVPWVTSLLDNHYHTLGYLRIGKNLTKMMCDSPRLTDTCRGIFHAATTGACSASNWSGVM